jgi:hypothetical protein
MSCGSSPIAGNIKDKLVVQLHKQFAGYLYVVHFEPRIISGGRLGEPPGREKLAVLLIFEAAALRPTLALLKLCRVFFAVKVLDFPCQSKGLLFPVS